MAENTGDPFADRVELPTADLDLLRAYEQIGRSVDELAYTPDFDRLYELYLQHGHEAPKHEVFRRLLLLRKSGLLPRLFRQAGGAVAS